MAEDVSGEGDEPVAGRWRLWLAGAAAMAAAGLLVALVLLVAASGRQRDADLDLERRSYDVIVLTRSLDAAMARSEAALGRFVISADRDTGTLYYREWKRAGQLLARLTSLTHDNPAQATRVKELAALYDQRGQELNDPAVRAGAGQGWAALSLFYKAGRAKSVPGISVLLDRIAAEERTVLGQRAADTARSTDRARSLAGMLSALGLMLALAAAALAWAVIHALAEGRRADQAARTEAVRADALEYAVAERTRELSEANAALRAEAETRAAAEAQLRQVQKMEAVGQLTGGIAHDFNNMLAVVVGGLDLARRRLDHQAAEVGRHIDNAMEGANRAAALTRRLLAFARAEPLLPEGVAPVGLIAGMSDLLDRTLGERITVETRLGEANWQVWCDPGQLENAILNLAVNARDAMEGEGRLVIATADVTLAPNQIGEAAAGEYVCISVRDTGCGMTPQVMERVFEPFFTTKPVGKGTGLGLSQVFGFARQSEGEIAIQSAPGEGTTVSLYLPRFAGAEPPAAIRPEPPQPAASGPAPARILVVEDDARVRAATVAALTELGHQPVPAVDGEEALALLATERPFQLIVTDVVMPGMTGPELIARIAPLHPETAILFVTGYAGEAGEAGQLAGRDVLRKPFTVRALERAVAQALSRNRETGQAA